MYCNIEIALVITKKTINYYNSDFSLEMTSEVRTDPPQLLHNIFIF